MHGQLKMNGHPKLAAVAVAFAVAALTPISSPLSAAAETDLVSSAPGSILVDPLNSHLRYEGRWDRTAQAATTVNAGARVFLHFRGDSVFGHFDLAGITQSPHVYAIVDGAQSTEIPIDQQRIQLTPPGLGSGDHILELVTKDVSELADRWNTPLESGLHLTGLELPAGSQVENLSTPALQFTFLGDSITQGSNVYCIGHVDGSDCDDATADYASLVANQFGAGLEQVGFSGQGITRPAGGNVPVALDSLNWNFEGSPATAWDPQVVVINEGTNDMLNPAGLCAVPPSVSCPPDPSYVTNFQALYENYLRAVRERYPNAQIIALAPFGIGGNVDILATTISGAVAAVGDTGTHFVDTRGWLGPTDFFDEIHPTAIGHRKVAGQLTTVIQLIASIQP